MDLSIKILVSFLGMVYMWPVFCKISAIAKKELFYAMPFGFTAWLCGTRFIDRSNPQKAKDSMNAALNYCKENKVIFKGFQISLAESYFYYFIFSLL